MIDQPFIQVLFLLGTAVAVVAAFQRLNIPSSLAYLLVGLLLGPYTAGPVIEADQILALAEFGIGFLLFTSGLNFSLPQIHALRHQILGPGTAQVVLTTAVIGTLAWFAGLPFAAAFVIGAVFAQSSTSIIGKQLADQGESNTQHGRQGLAMSVFQDITAVPFVIIIPTLAVAVGAETIASSLAWAMAKVVFAFTAVLIAGRWLLRPLFHLVAERRSSELFTLTVLFVSLMAAWTTSYFGLSLAFGAFLAGMMLGETEFRHQVESTIRPFRDVLIGLFFITIGMLIDPLSIPRIWHWAVLGAITLLTVKILLVVLILRWSGQDSMLSWRTAFLLAVGGEFGFAILAIALSAHIIDENIGQIALKSVLLSMIIAPLLIRYNKPLAALFSTSQTPQPIQQIPHANLAANSSPQNHVIICGYGRIGQNVGHFLEEEKIHYIAVDLDPVLVKNAHLAGEPVFYGDATEHNILDAIGINTARLVVVSHADVSAALKTLHLIRSVRQDLPIMVRTHDETHVDALRAAGATEIIPETLEASLMISAHVLLSLNLPLSRVVRRMRAQRTSRYQLLRAFFHSNSSTEDALEHEVDRLQPILITQNSPAIGRTLNELNLKDVVITALVRDGERRLTPAPDTRIEAGDALVLFGAPDDLQRIEKIILGQ